MQEESLFPNEGVPCEPSTPSKTAPAGGIPRVQLPIRNQVEVLVSDLDSLIADDNQVRSVCAFVEKVDLSKLYAHIRVVKGGAGRTAIDPRILLALWLHATLEGVGSARCLDELCVTHIDYRWLCGGVGVNYHTLADFRSEFGTVLEQILTDSVAKLRAAGLVTINRVAHDGLRVRASAGSASFRSRETLERFQKEAREQLQALKKELHDNPAANKTRQQAARERAARERVERIDEALRQYPDVESKKKDKKRTTRVSISDPDARKMHMPDGGFRPAYNVQLGADTESHIIVSVNVIQSSSDHGQLIPAIEQIEKQQGCTPKEMLLDGGFSKPEDVEAAATKHSCTIYAPLPVNKDKKTGEIKILEPKSDANPEIKAWHARMKMDESKTVYKKRSSTIECVNALARNRGLTQFAVRGLKKVYAVSLLFALAHNLMRAESLMKSLAQNTG